MPVTLSSASDQESDDSKDDEDPVNVSQDLPISPSEVVKSYSDLIRKIATSLSLSFSEPKAKVEDMVFDVVRRDVSHAVALSMTLVLLQAVRNSREQPASAQTSTKIICIGFRRPQQNSYTPIPNLTH